MNFFQSADFNIYKYVLLKQKFDGRLYYLRFLNYILGNITVILEGFILE